jgi:hypothetical protein
MSEPRYIPPSESLGAAVDALDAAWEAINKASVAFRLGIGNDGHPGHEAFFKLFDQLRATKSLIRVEAMHHAADEATDAEESRKLADIAARVPDEELWADHEW